MIKIGITGGIGSGKSYISKIFEDIYFPVFYTDVESKKILETNPLAIDFIKENYGEESYIDGKLNSKHLADILFNNDEELEKVTEIIQPILRKNLDDWFKTHENRFFTLTESAVMFEYGLNNTFDYIIYVDAPKDVRIERVLKRDSHRTKDDILTIMSKQIDPQILKKKCHIIIVNDGEEDMVENVQKVKEALLLKRKYRR